MIRIVKLLDASPSLLHVIASVQLVSDVLALILPSQGVVTVSDVIKSRANGNN